MFSLTYFPGIFAPASEYTAPGQIERGGDFPFQYLWSSGAVCCWNRVQKCLGVWVLWFTKQWVGFPGFKYFPQIHDIYSVAYDLYQREVMCDKEEGEPQPFFQINK